MLASVSVLGRAELGSFGVVICVGIDMFIVSFTVQFACLCDNDVCLSNAGVVVSGFEEHMSFADSWYRASCALLLLTLHFSMFSFYLPLSFSLSLSCFLFLSLSLSFSLSLFISPPSFSLWL